MRLRGSCYGNCLPLSAVCGCDLHHRHGGVLLVGTEHVVLSSMLVMGQAFRCKLGTGTGFRVHGFNLDHSRVLKFG